MTPQPTAYVQHGRITRPVHIAASIYKTGTTSLGEALVMLGVGERDMKYRPGLMKRFRPLFTRMNRSVGREVGARQFLAENGDRVREAMLEFTQEIAAFDVFSDAPMGHAHIHPFIRKAIAPEARFIWVKRRFKDWAASVRHWEVTHPETYTSHHMWETDPENKLNQLRKRRRRKYQQFRRLAEDFPDHCLELDMEELDNFGPLCAFYGVPDPGVAFPVSNVARQA
ncbi:sulfotransferase [Roseovarius salinarum]|uniref:sulfotransferase n=1 Tax=Roseovarius salinarum TaxID=1981892 RepID=UPI000C34A97A|nr:sulfotransferase [Roseovarius salinarum]